MTEWLNKLQVGDKLDVEVASGIWKIATVTNTCPSEIKIHYEYHDKWFTKTNNKLSPLHTHTINVIHLSKPSVIHQTMNETNSRPMYYKSTATNGHILIIMNNPETLLHNGMDNKTKHILQYNNANDTYETIKYPPNIHFRSHCSAINNESAHIYIYCNIERLFIIYDLIQKSWNITNLRDLPRLSQTKMIYVPSPFEQIHLFGIDSNRIACHFVYHLKNKRLLSLHSFNDKYNEHLKHFDLIYVPFQQKLMILGGIDMDTFGMCGSSDSIWTFALCDKYNPNRDIWNLYQNPLPHQSNDFTSTVAFKHVIFVFYFRSNEKKDIWCLDLVRNEWIKCEKLYPLKYAEDATKTDDNYVHYIYCGYMAFHVKMSLLELMPSQLIVSYKQYYQKLIHMYAGNMFERKQNMIVPMGVKQMIITYYPLFL